MLDDLFSRFQETAKYIIENLAGPVAQHHVLGPIETVDVCDLGAHDQALIRVAFVSVADLAIVTAQDLLRLGTAARMNTPGTSGGNWQWRYEAGSLDEKLAQELAVLTVTYGRAALQ